MDIPVESEESSLFDAPSARSMLSQQEMAYAHAVVEYNQTIMDGLAQPNLVNNFFTIARGFQDQVKNYYRTIVFAGSVV